MQIPDKYSETIIHRVQLFPNDIEYVENLCDLESRTQHFPRNSFSVKVLYKRLLTMNENKNIKQFKSNHFNDGFRLNPNWIVYEIHSIYIEEPYWL